MSQTTGNAVTLMPNTIDLRNVEQVNEYFNRLEQSYPQLIEAMRVMGISNQQYLLAMQALNQQSSVSTASAQIFL